MTQRLSWDEYFMSIAIMARGRSPDQFRKVGCVCASSTNRVRATGYNGIKAGATIPDGFYSDRENPLREQITNHAECNALDLCELGSVKTIYITCSPCQICAKRICFHGVNRVVYWESYHREQLFKGIFHFYGVKYSGLPTANKLNVINYLKEQSEIKL